MRQRASAAGRDIGATRLAAAETTSRDVCGGSPEGRLSHSRVSGFGFAAAEGEATAAPYDETHRTGASRFSRSSEASAAAGLQTKVLPLVGGETVLGVGSGNCRDEVYYAEQAQGVCCHAVDISSEARSNAKRLIAHAGCEDSVIVHANVRELLEMQFDRTTSVSLDHLLSDRELRELMRLRFDLLRPGGWAIIAVKTADSITPRPVSGGTVVQGQGFTLHKGIKRYTRESPGSYISAMRVVGFRVDGIHEVKERFDAKGTQSFAVIFGQKPGHDHRE